jgi:hypothetical protein
MVKSIRKALRRNIKKASVDKTGLPSKFRKTVLGDADIQGTGAPQYERLKKTLGRDKAEEVISNLKKEFKAEENPGLAKLPTKVRNRMGYKQTGGKVTAGSTSKGSTRGTPSQGARAYEAQIRNKQKFLDDMAKEEAARLKGKGGEIY